MSVKVSFPGLIEDTGEALQDVLVLELLIWFKKEFFTWVDSPVCENCDGKCVFKRIDEKLDQFPYTNRIEVGFSWFFGD